jgi:hypothetical protein
MSHSSWIRRVSVGCALFSAAVAALAAPTLWVSTGGAGLATVDVATGATSLIGSTGTALTDIAFSPSGDLYGISFSNLYKVNSGTGATTLVGGLGSVSGTANALVFGSDGTLYMAGSSLYSVNTSTGAASAIGAIGFQSGGDLAFIGGDLYMASSGNQLVEVDVTTGVGSLVGNLGVASMFGLATPDNVNLYGVAGQSVYLVNTTTGAATFQSTFNPALAGGAFGLAFLTESGGGGGNVPEPGTLALVALALLWVAAGRLRMRRLRAG